MRWTAFAAQAVPVQNVTELFNTVDEARDFIAIEIGRNHRERFVAS